MAERERQRAHDAQPVGEVHDGSRFLRHGSRARRFEGQDLDLLPRELAVERTAVQPGAPPLLAVHCSEVPKSCTNPKWTSPIVGPEATATDSEKKPMPRLAFSEPSIGSMTTYVPPFPTTPTSSDTTVTSSTPEKRARIARSAAASIAVVSSPPFPAPTTVSRSAR